MRNITPYSGFDQLVHRDRQEPAKGGSVPRAPLHIALHRCLFVYAFYSWYVEWLLLTYSVVKRVVHRLVTNARYSLEQMCRYLHYDSIYRKIIEIWWYRLLPIICWFFLFPIYKIEMFIFHACFFFLSKIIKLTYWRDKISVSYFFLSKVIPTFFS